jgi:putative MATE family efflux protein
MTERRNQKAAQLLEGPIMRSLLRLSLPIIAANILQAGYQLIDAFWVGRLGGDAVAAVAVSMPMAFLSMAFAIGLAMAGTTLVAQYVGARNLEMVDHVAGQTLLMIVIISIIIGIIGFAISPMFLHAMRVSPQVYAGALGFMRVSFIGMVFNFFFFMFQSLLRGVGEATLPVYIVLGTVALNFALDPLFIFGSGPIPGYGVAGAAMATLGTQSLAAIIGLVILVKGKYGIRLHLRDLRPDWPYIKRAFLLGFPASIEMSARSVGMMVMTFLITGFGTLGVATYGVGSNLLQVIIILAMGVSMAVSTLVGQNLGAGNIERAGKIGKLGALLAFCGLSMIGIAVFFTAPAVVAFFVPEDQAVIRDASVFLRIMCLSWGFIGVQMALIGVLRAAGSMVMAMILTLVSLWVFLFPPALILSKSQGIQGIWWAFPISYVLTAILAAVVYARGDWKKKKLISAKDKLVHEIEEAGMSQEAIPT